MIKWLTNLFDADGIRRIKQDPFSIRHIEFPNWKQQMAAVQADPKAISCIKSPDTLVIYEAVRINPVALKYISDIDEELADYAINLNPIAFKYIVRKNSDMSDKFYLKSLDLMPSLIRYLKKPTIEQQMAAVKAKHQSIGSIKNPAVEVCIEAVKKYPPHVKHLDLNKEIIIAYLEKITNDKNWRDKTYELRHANISESDWWEIVKEFPQHYELMELTEEQISFAQICS